MLTLRLCELTSDHSQPAAVGLETHTDALKTGEALSRASKAQRARGRRSRVLLWAVTVTVTVTVTVQCLLARQARQSCRSGASHSST